VELSLASALHRFEQQRLAEKIASGDEMIDAGDVHLDDTAGTHVHVPDLTIPHLPFG
jgi:hypothetical protein